MPAASYGHVRAAAPTVAGLDQRARRELRLSGAYQDSADQARAFGWLIVELAGHHLSVLSEPELVVEPLLDLAARLRR